MGSMSDKLIINLLVNLPQVDARLTPLAAMGLDRGTLIHDGLRLHSGVVYPGIDQSSAS